MTCEARISQAVVAQIWHSNDPDKISIEFLKKARARLQDLELEARTLLARL